MEDSLVKISVVPTPMQKELTESEVACGERWQIEFRGRNSRTIPLWWRIDPADIDGAFESQLGRVADGVAHRVDRLKAIGNGQVPLVAARAFQFLMQKAMEV